MQNHANAIDPSQMKHWFDPFAGLDDIEPIEKKSQYSDENEDPEADVIADERQEGPNDNDIQNTSGNFSNE